MPSFEITSNLTQKFINNPRLAVFMLLVISATLVISAQLFSKYISQKKNSSILFLCSAGTINPCF